MRRLGAVQFVALIEALKGMAVLAAGLGGLSLLHGNAQIAAMDLIRHLHLDPTRHYLHSLLDAAAQMTDARLWLVAGLATIYATVRFVEAYGLWYARRWAEWFAAASAAIYIPFEFYELVRDPGWVVIAVLTANLAVVAVMAQALRRRA